MKRVRVASAFVCFILLVGCGSKEPTMNNIPSNAPVESPNVELYESRHERIEGYEVVFDCYTVETEVATLHFAKRKYDKSTCESLIPAVIEILAGINDMGISIDDGLNIYIVNDTLYGRYKIVGNNVYCTFSEEDYTDMVMGIILHRYPELEYWKSIGLTEYFMNDRKNDLGKLKDYIAEAEDEFVALFPSYFWEEFSDKETIYYSHVFAEELARYSIEKYGLEYFLAEDPRDEWLSGQKMACLVDAGERIKVKGGVVDSVSCKEHTIVDERTVFFFEPTEWADNPQCIYKLYMAYLQGYEALMGRMCSESPAWYENINHMGEKIYVRLAEKKKSSYSSYSDKVSRTVYISRTEDILHELIHQYLHEAGEENHWLNEGLAEYFTKDLLSKYHDVTENELAYLTAPYNELDINLFEQKYLDCVRMYYAEKMGGLPTSLDEYDVCIAYEASGIADWIVGRKEINVTPPAIVSYGFKNSAGNRLTYPQACYVVGYLVEQIGSDKIVDVIEGRVDFESCVGCSTEELLDTIVERINCREWV